MFGIIDGVLASGQAVDATSYRATKAKKKSGHIGRTWAEQVASFRIAIAELTDRDRYKLEGREEDAEFRAVVTDGTDILEGDGIEISTTADHHAGRKFFVLAVRDPGGQYGRLLLTGYKKAKFGT